MEEGKRVAEKEKRSRRAGFVITDADIDILKFVHDYRVLTIEQVAKLTGRTYTRIHRRLKGLFDAGLLNRIEAPQKKDIYHAARPALRLLLSRGLITDAEAERRSREHELQPTTLEHEIMLSGIHLLLALATRTVPIELVAWKQGREIHHSFPATIKGVNEDMRIEPDAFVQIRETEGPIGERQTRNFLLEADRSTMGRKQRPGSRRMDEKVHKYLHYITQGEQRRHEVLKRFNVEYVRILTVTLTRRRRDSLAGSAAELLSQGYRKYFLYGSLEDLSAENPAQLFSRVFVRPGDAEELRQLLGPS
jgi:DNA-binding Lrp family transcriptional regulator